MTAAMWLATPMLAAIALEDVRHQRIRNRDVLVLATFTGVVVAALAMDHGGAMITEAIVGAGLAALPLGVAALAQPGRMGGGDVKMVGALALWLPPAAVVMMLIIMSLAGGALTAVMLVRHRVTKAQHQLEIPYGVAIAMAGIWLIGERFLNQFA